MSGVDIRFDREYLFVSKETGEHVIMKVENEGVVKRTRHAVRFKTQNYIQREVLGAVMPWEKIQMEDFNKLNLELVAEYDPEPEKRRL